MRFWFSFCSAGALAAVVFSTVSCTSSNISTQGRQAKAPESANSKLHQSFATRIFQLSTKLPSQNVLVSPYGLSKSLKMAYAGAGGKTKSEMQKVLDFEGQTEDEIARQSAALDKSLCLNPSCGAKAATAIFANKKIKFSDFYMASSLRSGSVVESMNFAEPSSLQRIDNWVQENSSGKSLKIVNRLLPDDSLYLLNTTSFNGHFFDKFEPAETMPTLFRKLDGSNKIVSMMNRTSIMSFNSGDDYQAVRLAFEDTRLMMYIFLPSEKTNLSEFIKNFTDAKWKQSWSQFVFSRKGHLGLPRFKLDSELQMTDLLRADGMKCALDPDCADFKRMANEKIWISKVIQKTSLDVNEMGKFTAVKDEEPAPDEEHDGLRARASSMLPNVPFFDMVCNRPFVVIIFDEKTDTMLAMGAIVDPEN